MATSERNFFSGDLDAAILKRAKERGLIRNEHQTLKTEEQEIVRGIHFRRVGFGENGEQLSIAETIKQVCWIHYLDTSEVIDPIEVQEQLAAFSQLLTEANNDYSKLSAEKLKFMSRGGHAFELLITEVMRTCMSDGYGLLAWYKGIPLAYNIGFHNTNNVKIPSLETGALFSKEDNEKIWTMWRVSVLEEMDEETQKIYEKIGYTVPPELKGKKFRKLGINNAFKIVMATAACKRKVQMMIYNAGIITRPDTVFDVFAAKAMRKKSLANMAIRGSNQGVFESQMLRHHKDRVRVIVCGIETVVADFVWEQYGNDPESVLEAEKNPEKSVLIGKGTWNIPQLEKEGEIFFETLNAHEKIIDCIDIDVLGSEIVCPIPMAQSGSQLASEG